MSDPAAAGQAESDELRFEVALLRRETQRLVTVNRTLEARLALAAAECGLLRERIEAMERSRPWRWAQRMRRLMGRRW